MNSPFFRAALAASIAVCSHTAFAQGIGGVTAASKGVTSGVTPSLTHSIPAATTAPATPAPAAPAPAASQPATTYIPLSPAQKAASDRNYALFNAANAGETWRIRNLLAKGANIEATDWQYGFTPLMWAAVNGHVGPIRYLLSRGAKINARSKAGVRLVFPDKLVTREYENGILWMQTGIVSERGGLAALDIAAAAGWGMAARELIKHGANVNGTNPDGDTALMPTVMRNDLVTTKALLARGANVNALDNHRRGALWWAAHRGNVGIVRALLARGARFTPDELGLWPSDAARMRGNKAVVSLLAGPEKRAKLAQAKAAARQQDVAGKADGAPIADSAMTRGGSSGNSGIIILN